MSTRSLQQERAHYAFQSIAKVRQETPVAVQNRFKAYSNAFPAMVQMNGLGQALAFAHQKGNHNKSDEEQGWKRLFDLLEVWLCQHRKIWGTNVSGHVLQALTQGNQAQYQMAQAETQALMSWVKTFARAEIKDDTGKDRSC